MGDDTLLVDIIGVLEEEGKPGDTYQLHDFVDSDALAKVVESFHGEFSVTFEVDDTCLEITESEIRTTPPVNDGSGLHDAPSGSISSTIDDIAGLLRLESDTEVYRWAIEFLKERIDASLVKIAVANEGFLVPSVSTDNGLTGREHAIPVGTTTPGAVYRSGKACRVPDLFDVRGAAGTATTNPTPERPGANRSLVCAPIGDLGVIVGLHELPDAFDEEDLAIAEAVGRLVNAHLAPKRRARTGADVRLLDEISSILSHEMGKSLTVARGNLDLAEEEGESKYYGQVRKALDGVESISDLVVTLARFGDPVEELLAVDLEVAAKSAFDRLDQEAELVVRESTEVIADPGCLDRILENLFCNAIDHSEHAVTIEVGLLENGFFVDDDGPGIPDEMKEAVFELGVSSRNDHQGTGLAIVKQLAGAHEWDVSVWDGTRGGTRLEVRNVVFGTD